MVMVIFRHVNLPEDNLDADPVSSRWNYHTLVPFDTLRGTRSCRSAGAASPGSKLGWMGYPHIRPTKGSPHVIPSILQLLIDDWWSSSNMAIYCILWFNSWRHNRYIDVIHYLDMLEIVKSCDRGNDRGTKSDLLWWFPPRSWIIILLVASELSIFRTSPGAQYPNTFRHVLPPRDPGFSIWIGS